VARTLACLLLLLLAAGCAPRVIGAGPATQPARLVDDWIAVMPDGAELPLEIWRPAETSGDGSEDEATPPRTRAAVVALHGFGDYGNAFRDLAPALARAGVAVYVIDQRGFGEAPHPGYWAGAEAMAGDALTLARLARADQAARGRPDLPVYLLGESMGGAVAMLAAARQDEDQQLRDPPVSGLILSAPAVWGRDWMPAHQRAGLWLGVRLFPWLPLNPSGLGIRPTDNIQALRELSRDPLFRKTPRVDLVHGLVDLMDAAQAAAPGLTLPILVLYGDRDEVVPRPPTCALLERLPTDPRRWRVVLVEGGYHMLFRDLDGDRVIADIAAWARDPEAPLPSGDERDPAAAGETGLRQFCGQDGPTG